MSEKRVENYRSILVFMSVLSVGFLLASSVGFFDGLLSVSEKAQASYRIRINSFSSKSEDFIKAVYDIANIKKERDQYKSQTIELRSQIADLESTLNENSISNMQCRKDFAGKYKLIPAQVIRYKPEEPGLMIINKGSSDGAVSGDIIVFDKYAIGELVDVHKYSSIVRTLKAGDSQVLVISNKGVKGVLIAKNGREFWVEEILSETDVQKGDEFTTLGVNSNFVPDLYVGEVIDVQKTASGTTKEVKLRNDLDFGSLREIYILHHEN